jgi:hypothetical protein
MRRIDFIPLGCQEEEKGRSRFDAQIAKALTQNAGNAGQQAGSSLACACTDNVPTGHPFPEAQAPYTHNG